MLAKRKPMFFVIIGCSLLIVGLATYKAIAISIAIAQSGKFAPPPEAITSLVVKAEHWEPTIDVVGSLEAIEGVTVSAEEAGQVTEVAFSPGSDVKQGEILVQLDVAVEDAGLRSAEAAEKLAKLNFDRLSALVSRKLSAQADLDAAKSQLDQSLAAVKEMRARIARKTITAPFDGRVGIREVSLGQYVEAGQAIVPLFRIDPLYLNVSVPQQSAHQVRVGQVVKFTVDSFGTKVFEGAVTGINPHVDESTRNVRIQATVRNDSSELRPGMFVNASLVYGAPQSHITLPSTAISYAPYGDSVFVIETQKGPDGSEYRGVRQQFVQIGLTRGDQVAVYKGLKEGEEVATSGVFKLRPGAAVHVDNSIQPANEAEPNPIDS